MINLCTPRLCVSYLLLRNKLAGKNPPIYMYILIFSKIKMFYHFFQHLAYGLSGMYSSLPRKLEGPNFTDSSWYRLSNMDLSHLPDVVKFLATLGISHCYLRIF